MSRPLKYAKPVSVRLLPDDLVRLTRLSEESGHSMQELIRACVVRALPYVEQVARRPKEDNDASAE